MNSFTEKWIGVWVGIILVLVYHRLWQKTKRKKIIPPNAPPCAYWKTWTGAEIEGITDVGDRTLFIREICHQSWFSRFVQGLRPDTVALVKDHYPRVWFCSEFREWRTIKEILAVTQRVCIEVDVTNLAGEMPPVSILMDPKVVIYYKVPVPVREGDHVCVGLPFNDEAFLIGTGKKVAPESYMQDIEIC